MFCLNTEQPKKIKRIKKEIFQINFSLIDKRYRCHPFFLENRQQASAVKGGVGDLLFQRTTRFLFVKEIFNFSFYNTLTNPRKILKLY